MLSRIFELFQNPKTKVGGRITPEYMEVVPANARFGVAATRPENLLSINTEAKQWHYDKFPAVEVGRLYPIINVNVQLPGTGQDTRWFLRKHDAIAYVVGLRLEYSEIRGVEDALRTLGSC